MVEMYSFFGILMMSVFREVNHEMVKTVCCQGTFFVVLFYALVGAIVCDDFFMGYYNTICLALEPIVFGVVNMHS